MGKKIKTLSKEDKEYWQKRKEDVRWTYIWNYPHPEMANHYLRVDSFYLNPILPHFKLVDLDLFAVDEKTRKDTKLFKKFLNRESQLKDSLNTYFFSVLAHNPMEKEMQGLEFQKFSTIVIPNEIKDEIEKIIEQFKLLKLRDCVFYLIAKIQNIYVKEISYYQSKQRQKEIKDFKNTECKKLIDLVKRYNDTTQLHLEKINFVFKDKSSELKQNDTIIAIKTPVLIAMIMDAFAPFNEKKYSEWKTHIEKLPDILYSQHKKNLFKKNIVKALHTFFVKEAKLKPTASWKLIVQILQFSLIEIKHIKVSDAKADVDLIRQWLKR